MRVTYKFSLDVGLGLRRPRLRIDVSSWSPDLRLAYWTRALADDSLHAKDVTKILHYGT